MLNSDSAPKLILNLQFIRNPLGHFILSSKILLELLSSSSFGSQNPYKKKAALRLLRFCACSMEASDKKTKYSPSVYLQQWSQWQLFDSILPTGGFAHSSGLEAAMQARHVVSPQDLKTYVIHVLDNTGSLLLPFVYSATISPDAQTWHKLDVLLNAMLTNEIGRKASVSQGSALMRVAASVFTELPSLKNMRSEALSGGTFSFHHAPIFGLVCGLLGFDAETTQRAFVFVTMRDVISAATRLNLVGPMGAAVLQHEVSPIAEDLSRKWMNRGVEEACQTCPLIDTVQGCHGYLFSRLFCS